MKLWSWQTPDFSLVDGTVDHTRGEYYRDTQNVPEAYDKLSQLVGTEDWIFCYIRRNDHSDPPSGGNRCEWELDIPQDEILRFLDDVVWNSILDIRCSLSTERRQKIWSQVLEREPYNAEARKALERRLTEEFFPSCSKEQMWTQLSVDGPGEAGDQRSALVQHPVDPGRAKLTGRVEGGVARGYPPRLPVGEPE